jgi:hypothetical protein
LGQKAPFRRSTDLTRGDFVARPREWRVVFPDAPGCEVKGFSLDDANFACAAASALSQCLRETGTPPLPMDMAAVEKCEEWLEQNHMDLSKAVVTMIFIGCLTRRSQRLRARDARSGISGALR